MRNRIAICFLAMLMLLSFTACGTGRQNTKSEKGKANFSVGMVTDTGGVNDQSFNQSSWEGLKQLKKDTGAAVSYLESVQETEYAPNLDKQVDEGRDLVWGIGFAMADAVTTAAQANPDVHFAILDKSYGKETPQNVTGVVFRAQEPSFIVGYIAGLSSKTGKVGFVGGMKGDVIEQFEYGYRSGVEYAARELGKDLEMVVQYADSFSDSAKAKAIATKMFSKNCDIVFHAAGGAGVGVIEAAKETGNFAIGVDRDQAYLAPDNVLTSALKLANVAVEKLSMDAMNGTEIGGKTYTYGLAENAVGIPTENKNMDPQIYQKAIALEQKIKDGDLVPPYDKKTFEEYMLSSRK